MRDHRLGAGVTEDEAREKLTLRLRELVEEQQTNADARDTVTLQQDSVGRLSRMDALQQQAMAQAQERRRAQEGMRIEAALKRIEAGEWGYCLTCGEEIAAARLAHDPSVATCVKCASA